MPLDQALIGSIVTGVMAIVSQIVSKARCYTICKEGHLPMMVCGFLETPLTEIEIDKFSETDNESEH